MLGSTGVAAFNFALLFAANYAQHILHPPTSLCESATVKRFGTTDWRPLFKPWVPDPVHGAAWTPAHEARLQEFSGKWVYISAIIIFLHMIYFGLSLLVELRKGGKPGKLATAVYGVSALVHGLATVVIILYVVMWYISTYVIYEWKNQWYFFQE